MPVEIWLKIMSHFELNDIFNFLNVSKSCYDVLRLHKTFEDKKGLSKHLLLFDFGLLDFIENELIYLGKDIENSLKVIIDKDNQVVFGVVNIWVKKLTYELLPFKIFCHTFYYIRGMILNAILNAYDFDYFVISTYLDY